MIPIDTSDKLFRSDSLSETELAERIAHSGAADHIIRRVFRENPSLAEDLIERRNPERDERFVPTDGVPNDEEPHGPSKEVIIAGISAAGIALSIFAARHVVKKRLEGDA